MEQIEQLKQLRLEIDSTKGLLILAATRVIGDVSEEMADAHFNMKMAKAYVGKLLGEIGEPTPYKNDGNRKTVEDIEPEDATTIIDTNKFSGYSYVEQVDYLREYIQTNLIKPISELPTNGFSKDANIYRTQVFVCLTDARLHLGFELGRLRQEKNGL